ncbi:class I SAM-dependent rRNA methyltransferase [Desulfobotulus sp.]|jgi:23S rRNA (cytosine1962-C5)-methyltransferase|uniref:class I SAM-dependent rRNA methyltransferase n=1 Tax=Desulfobotulus sp. TaxID=1940337 RepID=UPI002A362DF0|nr:class I SAM-dependent methyltransferase [Desulfobotulus sp.]MDY0162376.1 class I SAM-dependent methyltransferase [Desulfobotulus sp.]
MSKEVVISERGAEALERRHPWVFSGAVRGVRGNPGMGETVALLDAKGRWLGWGAYSPASQIRVRVWTFDPEERVDGLFFEQRIQAALSLRSGFYPNGSVTALRLVSGESDGLPGLIVDRYDKVAVCQFLSAGAHRWKAEIVSVLATLPGIESVYERSDAEVRKKEGLCLERGLLHGPEPEKRVEIREGRLRFWVDIREGHKTGFYLDQRENRSRVMAHASGMRVLNAFSYTGGFGIAALAGDAARVVNLDASRAVLDMAEDNLRLNGACADAMENVEGNAFQVLRAFRNEGRLFDVVVLDPPKFAESRAQLNRAARGYKDINILGMQLLAPGGLLFTYSCSGAMHTDLFQKIVADAALDAGREGRILRRMAAAPDHPVSLNFPEGEYLKGLMVQLV